MTNFSENTLRFLAENRLNNSRVWYQAHKKEYTDIVFEPLCAFCEALAPTMTKIDDLIVTQARVDKTISRIYRDTRFSRDKSLYRDVVWCVFSRDKHVFECPPAFFFEISPRGFRWGMGYYEIPQKVLSSLRELILSGDEAFVKALSAYANQTTFTIEGERYKRSKYPERSIELREWLDRKNIDFVKNSTDMQLLFSERATDMAAQDFLLLAPMYQLFLKAAILSQL